MIYAFRLKFGKIVINSKLLHHEKILELFKNKIKFEQNKYNLMQTRQIRGYFSCHTVI